MQLCSRYTHSVCVCALCVWVHVSFDEKLRCYLVDLIKFAIVAVGVWPLAPLFLSWITPLNLLSISLPSSSHAFQFHVRLSFAA